MKTDRYDRITYLENDSDEHDKLALLAAQKSVVLLKNDGVLPLREEDYPVIGVIGPNADSVPALEGNYNGTSSRYVTNLQGIRDRTGSRVLYSVGAHLYKDRFSTLTKYPDDRMSEAVSVVKNSDIVILSLGLDATLEGEEGDTGNMFASGDKLNLLLPDSQIRLCNRVFEAAEKFGRKVIVALNAGSAIDLSFIKDRASAILMCWYSGQEGGHALADILFGSVNPSGHLPVTFYKDGTLPDFRDYSMKNRTYRYFKGEVLYPFGYGLSYTDFTYETEVIKTGDFPDPESDYETLKTGVYEVQVRVSNTGSYDGDALVRVYVEKKPHEKIALSENAAYAPALDPDDQPIKSLCGFCRAFVKKGEAVTVKIPVNAYSLTTVLEDGRRVLLHGTYDLTAEV